MKVLVTGATGFLGKWMVRKLLKEGVSVRTLRRKSSQFDISHPLLEDFWGDITDSDSVNAACKDVEAVFHLAGYVGYSRADRRIMEMVNVEGTRNVVSAVQKNRVQRLVHMSSVVAVGASRDGKQPLNESSPYNLQNLDLGYFETKRKAEELVKAAVQRDALDAVILNPSTIYGPGDGTKGSRKVQIKVAKGKFRFYTGGGVSIVGVDEVVDATYTAWLKGKTGERYILSGDNITIKDLFQLIATAAGVHPPNCKLPDALVRTIGVVGDGLEKVGRKGPLNSESAWTSLLFHWFDNQKARQYLGLNPKPAAVSIGRSIAWMRENGILSQ